MAEKEFSNTHSITTIAGSSFPNFMEAMRGKQVDPPYRMRLFISGIFSLFSEPFRWVENLRYGRTIRKQKIEEDPIFIVGHWRSGTTYLHNLMCQDPNMAYVTTYQGVFPNQVLSAKWFYRTLMNLNMPKRRAADNVQLGPDYPQEEELAMGNMNPYSYYYFFYFPRMAREFCDRYILMRGFEGREKERWKKDYLTLLKKTLINTKGTRFIAKNPSNTGRIPLLLEMFPNARFIHIYRNPLTVFPSTVNFFAKTLPTVILQDIDREELEENVFYVYDKMMRKYEEDKQLVPPQNLIEIRYEDFEKQPLEELHKIYRQLNLPGFERSREQFEAYIATQQEFQVNNHNLSQEEISRVAENWQYFMELWGYAVPEKSAVA